MACRDEMLQWGRSRLAPENAIEDGTPEAENLLQWGRSRLAPENGGVRLHCPLLYLASMGPEPVSSGKRHCRSRRARSAGRFNGAGAG